jgi:hypothetical protein
LAWWKRGRINWNDLKNSTPFFILSLALGALTVWSENRYYQNLMEVGPSLGNIYSRLEDAGLITTFYLAKALWPVGLLPIYPKWALNPYSVLQWLPWPLLIGIIYHLWSKRATWGRHALFGLGFFLINLIPFMGFTASGYMSFTWVMDHFLYLPIIGVIGLMVVAVEQVEGHLTASRRPYLIGALAVVIALMALESHNYAGIFINEKTILNYTLNGRGLAKP